MAKKQRPPKKRQHGGAREGAGRPTLDPKAEHRLILFTPEQLEKVERWRTRHDVPTFREAVRQMIEAAAEADR